MKIPIRYEPNIGLFDANGKLITDFADSDFELEEDDKHAIELMVSRNSHEALVRACEALPLDVEFVDAADFKDNSRRFLKAMDLARAALAAIPQ